MNRSLATALFGLATASSVFAAAAGTISLETRADFVYEKWDEVLVQNPTAYLKNAAGKDSINSSGTKVYDTSKKLDREDNMGFAASRLRADFKGQFANDVKYRLRLRFDKTVGSNKKIGSVNSLDGMVDNAWVQPKLTDFLSIRAGKFTVEGQGHEEATISSQDVYLFSTIDKYYLAGNSVAYGVRPIIHLEGLGEINITLANNNLVTSEDSTAQQYLIYGIGFVGKMGMFEPVANFHMVPKTGWNEGQMDAGLGLRTTIDKFVNVIDFQTQTTNKVMIDKNLDKVLSGNMVLQYKGENFRPQAKVNYDMLYNGDDKTSKVLGIGGGLEYYPVEKDKFRYHVMVTDKRTTPVKDGDDQTTQSEIKVYAGISCGLDMWKF